MSAGEHLHRIEAAYLAARSAKDGLDVARARGQMAALPALEARALATAMEAGTLLEGLTPADEQALVPDDRRALAAIRAGLAEAEDYRLPVAPEAEPGACDDLAAWDVLVRRGGEPLARRLEACYAVRAADLRVGAERLSRLGVLARLATEPDPAARRTLFLGLEPLWHVVNGNGRSASPYRRLVQDTAVAWRSGASPIEANAAALGVTADDIATWALTALAGWRAAVVEPARVRGEPPVEPWDWWWSAGAAARLVGALPLPVVEAVNREWFAALGADLDRLAVTFDLQARPGRPEVPVAFTGFGARPHRRSDGTWSPGQPLVMASLSDGGLSELGELVHETGHAVHIAGIRTRPAFVEWPDSDALTEALADLVAFDVSEPAWQARWLPDHPAVPEPVTMRSHYASAVLDAAWALFEMRMVGDPGREPNEVWTELTSTWLGIVPHPEWSWWAIRGQLVQEPGYMANYAVGAVLATDVRAAIREARGPWLDGDTGWYPWVQSRIYRWGRERTASEVLQRVLGRPPTADALLREIARARPEA